MGNIELLDRTWAFGLADHKTWHNHLCFILARNQFFGQISTWDNIKCRKTHVKEDFDMWWHFQFHLKCPKNFGPKPKIFIFESFLFEKSRKAFFPLFMLELFEMPHFSYLILMGHFKYFEQGKRRTFRVKITWSIFK